MKESKKIGALKKCRDEYISRKDECSMIIISWKRGDKSGIISRKLMDAILQLCADFTQGMIDKLEGKEPERYCVAVIRDPGAAQTYEEEGIDGLNKYIEEWGADPIYKEFDTEAEQNAYLQGLADIGAGDERAPASYAVIMDEDYNKLEV